MRTYRTSDVVRITGINRKTLHHWARTNFVVPSVQKAKGTGSRRLYSFSDLIALRVVKQLRHAGVSVQALRKVAAYLRKRGFEEPFAEVYLVTDGKDVQAVTQEGLLSVFQAPGQQMLFHLIDLRHAATDVNDAIRKLEQQGGLQAEAS
jgi:DNA-binding transcriptional MerR regulator